MNLNSPNRSPINGSTSGVLERSLILNHNKRQLKRGILWGILNFCFLCVLVYDVSYICPLYLNYTHYVEQALILVLAFNVLYHFYKVMRISLVRSEPIRITLEQKQLLGVTDLDQNYKLIESPNSTSQTPSRSQTNTPMNLSARSWRSPNISQNDSANYSISTSWTYLKGTPDKNTGRSSNRPSPISFSKASPLLDSGSAEPITNEDSLNSYLREHEVKENARRAANKSQQSSNLLSSFWSHPVTKTAKDMSSFLKKCQYQLSTITSVKSGSPGVKEDKTSSPGQISALEIWTRINVDSVALTQWNENLRKWISQTILERIVNEFDRINASLEKHGLTDVKIGCVGLERLRKTAHMVPIAQFIPSLATLLPFLEVTTNQEYLVKRIRELAKGGCMSEFKWNGGSSYNGKEWDDSLPTDCAIIMHMLACYLDTQLMPLPNMPDMKAFSGHHYIKVTDKMPTPHQCSLLIQQVSEKPPHYRVVVGEKVYEMVKGYNNLFHSILFFVYNVNKMEHGMLGRVNLGRAGINILWVIDQ